MSFRDILRSLGPHGIVPERLLGEIMSIQSSESLNESLALLLAEIITPGSQSLTGMTNEITALTPLNIPEAAAKGSQLGSIIRKLSLQPTWDDIFQSVNRKLPSPVFTEASLTELLSALDDQTIDKLLEFEWSLDFKISLFVTLRKLNPQNGSFDLLKTNYLKPIIKDTTETNIRNTLLYFKSVTNLELHCISMSTVIQNQEFKKFLHQVFEDDIKTAPELVALGCVQFSPSSATVDDLFENLMVHLLDDTSARYSLILEHLKDDELLLRICMKIVETRSASVLNKMLLSTVVQRGFMNKLLSSMSFETGLEIASLSLKCGYIGFEQYLKTHSESPTFVNQIMGFLSSQIDLKRESRTANVKAVYILLQFITSSPHLTEIHRKQMIALQTQVVQAFPRIINFGFGHDEAILANDESSGFAYAVEQKMKALYQRMYNHDMDIKSVISMLQTLRDSDVPADQDLFACMIHSLLDEFKFFPEYPLAALAITSVLFGSMIHFDLMRDTALQVALNYIYQSCNQPPESNMFKFAVQALFAFRQRLHEFPNYCKNLSLIESLKSQPQVYQFVFDVVNKKVSETPELQVQTEEVQRTQHFRSVNKTSAISNNVTQEQPRQDVSQRILFVMNNLSEENLTTKADDLKTVLTPSVYEWLANYLVSQRAKTEPNNHHLYSDLVHRIGDELLFDHVINVSVLHVNDLLVGGDENPTERTHLKNLGSWLGLMTVARNKPLRHRNIALKELLIEASDQKRLALVIPFVCKIIDQTKASEIFKLPNPWTLGILKVLAELYESTDMKLNLRFEIEVLCNNLDVDLKSITPSTIIRKHDPRTLIETGIASLALDSKPPVADQQHFMQIPRPQQQMMNVSSAVAHPGSRTPASPQVSDLSFQNLSGTTSFVTNPALKQIFVTALMKSIQEILPPAVERAVSIGVTTARALVLKDFATEVDDMKLRKAAVLVVRQLAESLALATCRDPLKESIQSSVHGLISSQLMVPLDDLPQAIADNIDTACLVVQKAAMDKATHEIDDVLASSIAVRRSHREKRPDQPFFSQHLSRYSVTLPEPLGLGPSGVTAQQAQLYDNFGSTVVPAALVAPHLQPSVNSLAPANADTPVIPIATPDAATAVAAAPTPTVSQPSLSQTHTSEQLIQFIQTCIEGLVRFIAESSASSLHEVSPESQIRALFSQVLNTIVQNSSKDLLLLKSTQLILTTLLSTSNIDLSVDVFVLLLEKLCVFSESIRKDIAWWFEFVPDNRKFNVKILVSLFSAKLITPVSFDGPLSRNVSSSSLDFTIELIDRTLCSTSCVALLSDFACTLETLEAFRGQNSSVDDFLSSVHKHDVGILSCSGTDVWPESGSMSYLFLEWIHLTQNHNANDDMQSAYVLQLLKNGIFDDQDRFDLFMRCAIEIAVDYFKNSDPNDDGFLAADCLSKLLVKIVFLQDSERKMTLKRGLEVFTLVFSQDHDASSELFNERPYFRFISSFLAEWDCSDLSRDLSLTNDLYLIFADYLNIMQPLVFPGFSFAWMTLLSHRFFLPRIMSVDEGESKFVVLLLALLRFQSRYVKTRDIPEVFTVIYKGTLRLFLLLLHDYPGLLVKHHYQLCCEIPAAFIQLRNIVLSAFPKTVSMPDPFTQGLKVDRLSDISRAPEVTRNPALDLPTKKIIDGYLRIPTNMPLKSILNGLKQDSRDEPGIGYSSTQFNIKAINALVLYVGMQAVADRPLNGQIFNPKSSHFNLLAALMQEGSVEFQYQFISAICNQLRYPNSHTHWFSYLILHFFGSQSLWNGKKVQVQHIITRVLLERVICNRPHPWGLLITFVELLKNAELAFFDLPFIKTDPELERLFTTLLRHFSAVPASGSSLPA